MSTSPQSGDGPRTPAHILIADDDVWLLRMISTVLGRRGYSIELATDGQDALDKALAHPPDLLITDALMPRLDGFALVKALRARPGLADLPVIFLSALSSDEDRIRGFRLGADDYVTKPFRYEEFDLRVARTLRRTRSLVHDEIRDSLHGAGLKGDLGQIGLPGLLVLIDLERKTGRLALRGPDGQTAHILVREGRVIQAQLHGRMALIDVPCIHEVVTWSAGDFEFVACVVAEPDRVQTTTTHLLLEGARLLDEGLKVQS